MLYLFDYISLGIVLVLGLIGYKKGAISTLLDLVGLIASFIIAWNLAPAAGAMLLKTPGVGDVLVNYLTKVVMENGVTQGLTNVANTNGVGLSADLINQIIGQADITQGVQTVVTPVATQLLTLVSFVVMVVVFNVVLTIVRRVVRKVDKLPIVGSVNHVLGMIFGLASAVAVSSIVVLMAYSYAGISANAALQTELQTGAITATIIETFL